MAKAKRRAPTITMQPARGAQRDRLTELMDVILGALTDHDASLIEGVEVMANVLVRTYDKCTRDQRQLIEESMELTLRRMRGEPLPEPLPEAKA